MQEERRNDFFCAVLALNDEEECAKFFDAILSISELREVTNRWEIFLLLQQGLHQREITDRLGVAVSTVSRGNRAYRGAERLLRSVIERLSRGPSGEEGTDG